ncbi:unnamed protein product, partial [Prorocentrum cordatum]
GLPVGARAAPPPAMSLFVQPRFEALGNTFVNQEECAAATPRRAHSFSHRAAAHDAVQGGAHPGAAGRGGAASGDAGRQDAGGAGGASGGSPGGLEPRAGSPCRLGAARRGGRARRKPSISSLSQASAGSGGQASPGACGGARAPRAPPSPEALRRLGEAPRASAVAMVADWRHTGSAALMKAAVLVGRMRAGDASRRQSATSASWAMPEPPLNHGEAVPQNFPLSLSLAVPGTPATLH